MEDKRMMSIKEIAKKPLLHQELFVIMTQSGYLNQ